MIDFQICPGTRACQEGTAAVAGESAAKCAFHQQSVSVLGVVVAVDGIRMDNEKVKAVSEWPVPTSRKELQRFLGFAYFYQRFVQDYSKIAAPQPPSLLL